jgi:hypothetical protein
VPAAQTVAQPPQFLPSLIGSTQVPPHSIWPRGQLVAQRPSTHAAPDGQTVAQSPQWPGSLVTSTHSTPQAMAGGAQSSSVRERHPAATSASSGRAILIAILLGLRFYVIGYCIDSQYNHVLIILIPPRAPPPILRR